MKNLILLLTLSLIVINCNETGGGSSNPSGADCTVCGEYISRDVSKLGTIAQYIIQNDNQINNFYYARNAGDGQIMFKDSQIVAAVRGYVNSKTKTVDVQGEMNVLSETPFDAFYEATYVADGSSRGVSQQGLCYIMADVYDSFGIQVDIINASGVTHELAPNGSYCALELTLPNGKLLVDPYINRTFKGPTNSWMSLEETLEIVDAGQITSIILNPDGMVNAMVGWGPINGFYHKLETLTDEQQSIDDLLNITFNSLNKVSYSSIRP